MAQFKVGSFTKNTATGSQAVAGVGFTPKALVLWTSGSTAASGTWSADIYQALGFTAGATNSYAVAGFSDEAVATSITSRRIAAKAITMPDAAGSAILFEADLTSFDADGFTLNWTTNAAPAAVINFLAIGGAEVSAKVVTSTASTAVTTKGVTGVGFTPDLVVHASAPGSVLSIPASAAHAVFSLGAMDAAGGQWANALLSEDAQAVADTWRYQRTDRALASFNLTGALDAEATFQSMDADGFTLNWLDAASGAFEIIHLCLAGVDAKVGSFTKTSTNLAVSQAVSGVGFQPSAVLFASNGQIATTTITTDATWMMGATDGTAQRAFAQRYDDGSDPAVAHSIWRSGAVISLPKNASATNEEVAYATCDSLDADGFTLGWVPGGFPTTEEQQVLYLGLASSNVAPNAPTLVTPIGNATIDRTTTQRFDWDFSDDDPGDTQSQYELRYKLVADASWTTVGPTASTSTFHDFAPATFAAGSYEWQVRTWDAIGTEGPWSGSEFFTAASPPSAPTITDPINGATIGTEDYTVEWSAPSQASYQLRRVADAAGSADTATVYSDTGEVVSSVTRSRVATFATNNRFEHVQVRVKVSGVWSTWASNRVEVSYTVPPTPTLVAAGNDSLGYISVAITNPAPGAGEPDVNSNNLYRREGASGDGIRIATGIANGGTYNDYAVASGVAYEYKAVAVGDNGTTASGAWTA